jgi:hypothetical protein
MYAKGIQIYCAPTADDRETWWIPTMRHIAFEGRCFVLSACQYICRGDYPADYPAIQGDDPQTVLMRGGSLIVNPLGCVLAGPDYSGEKILTADLDPGEVAEGKFDLDVAGVSKTGRVVPSPKPQMSRSMAVGISLRCLPSNPSGPKNSAVQYSVPPSRSMTPITRYAPPSRAADVSWSTSGPGTMMALSK